MICVRLSSPNLVLFSTVTCYQGARCMGTACVMCWDCIYTVYVNDSELSQKACLTRKRTEMYTWPLASQQAHQPPLAKIRVLEEGISGSLAWMARRKSEHTHQPAVQALSYRVALHKVILRKCSLTERFFLFLAHFMRRRDAATILQAHFSFINDFLPLLTKDL